MRTHAALGLSAALTAALSCPSCQTMSTAPRGSPRVEVEVSVALDESFTAKLEKAAADDAVARAVVEQVLAQADLGLRFYPVLARDYGPRDQRPEYALAVSIADLEAKFAHRTVQPVGSDPVVETSVQSLACAVSTVLTKRRAEGQGPALTVARGTGRGETVAASGAPGDEPAVAVSRAAANEAPVSCRRADLVLATRRALDRALADLVPAVDRELALSSGHGEAPAAPGAPTAPR